MNTNKPDGKVILAGAGPGDPDLITIKLQDKLRIADVIIADRLVNPLIIERNANKNALIITAGKQGYNDASVTQEQINDLIIKHSSNDKLVVRLKGGDVAFFSNVLDELNALIKNNIAFEIIPGITAASGASAYAGIPLTARGYSQGVQFVTYNLTSNISESTWRGLSMTENTLVFYMSAKNLGSLSESLLRFSKDPTVPIAIIEQATTIHQAIHISTLENCTLDFAAKDFSSPSLIIIGNVVNLYKDFKWFTPQMSGSVFNELITVS